MTHQAAWVTNNIPSVGSGNHDSDTSEPQEHAILERFHCYDNQKVE